MSLLVPTVSEQTPRGERLTDLFSRLLNSRIVFLGTQVDEVSANRSASERRAFTR